MVESRRNISVFQIEGFFNLPMFHIQDVQTALQPSDCLKGLLFAVVGDPL